MNHEQPMIKQILHTADGITDRAMPTPMPIIEERTYTQAEVDELLRLNQAAALRETTKALDSRLKQMGIGGLIRGPVRDFILALGDQPALAKHDLELVERMKDHLLSMEGWMTPQALDRHDAELLRRSQPAQAAAQRELDALLVAGAYQAAAEAVSAVYPDEQYDGVLNAAVNRIKKRTPADALAAMERQVREAQLQEAELRPHDGECLMFNGDGSKTGLDCTCTRGKRIALLTLDSPPIAIS